MHLIDAIGESEVGVAFTGEADVIGFAALSEVTGARGHAADADVGGKVADAVGFVDDKRSHAGVDEGGVLRVAGLEFVGGAAVITVCSCDGTDDGAVVHLLRREGEDFADLHTVSAGFDGFELASGGASWLGIPCIDVAHAAAVPEEDDGLCFCGVVCAEGSEEAVNGHAEEGSGPREPAEEPATGNGVVVAGGHGFIWLMV